MTYITNSITSANPAADLYTAMASALTSAGFTLVDTVVISTRTHKVWKSAAANNAQGLDWYLDVAYTTTGAGHIWMNVFEDFNPATDQGIRGGYNSTADNNQPEATYYSRYGATGSALETNWTTVSNNMAVLQCQTTNFAYWISVTGDRVIGMTSVRPLDVIYCGMFDMYLPWANKIGALAYPLVVATLNAPESNPNQNVAFYNSMNLAPTNTSTTNPIAVTRVPPVASTYTSSGMNNRWNNAAAYAAYNQVTTIGSSANGSGIGGVTGMVDLASQVYYDAARGGKIAIALNWGSSSLAVTVGTFKDVNIFGANSVARGDTVTISGSTWVLSNQLSNRVFGFKAA